MDYLIEGETLTAIPRAFRDNNPAMPFPDCVSLRVVYTGTADGEGNEVFAHLRFGAQALRAHLREKSFSFSLRLSKAKLRLLAVEGVRIQSRSVKGTDPNRPRLTLHSSLAQSSGLSKDLRGKISLALAGATSPLDALRAAVGLGLKKEDQATLITHMESSRDFSENDAGFDETGPFWHFMPNFDIAESFRQGKVSRQKTLSGNLISFGDGPLFKFKDVSNRHGLKVGDGCLLFGVSANIRDIEIELDDDCDNAWWNEVLAHRGFKEKKEVARVAIRKIIAQRIAREAPDDADGNLLFVVAAVVPEDG